MTFVEGFIGGVIVPENQRPDGASFSILLAPPVDWDHSERAIDTCPGSTDSFGIKLHITVAATPGFAVGFRRGREA